MIKLGCANYNTTCSDIIFLLKLEAPTNAKSTATISNEWILVGDFPLLNTRIRYKTQLLQNQKIGKCLTKFHIHQHLIMWQYLSDSSIKIAMKKIH
jgi:hypothetical protein